jgi:hypothetical protein
MGDHEACAMGAKPNETRNAAALDTEASAEATRMPAAAHTAPNTRATLERGDEKKSSRFRPLWVIVAFTMSAIVLLSDLHEVTERIVTFDRALLVSLKSVDTWSLLEAYFGQYRMRGCNDCGAIAATWYFIPVTRSVIGQAMSHGPLPFLWVVGGIGIACILAWGREGNLFTLPMYVLGFLFLETLAATFLVFLLEFALTGIGRVLQVIGLICLPSTLVFYVGQGHTIVSFVESTKELLGLTRWSAKTK